MFLNFSYYLYGMKERRVVNLDKESYQKIKEYCDANALDMPKWIEKIMLEKIEDTKDVTTLLLENLKKGKKLL